MNRTARGVSLVEALVALAVMAFGILGIVGLQMGLRHNADVSKQRGEAVRIAQEVVEQRRAFSAMAAASGVSAFADIVTQPATAVAGVASNTTFMLSQTVTDLATPPRKLLTVDVSWQDRTGQDQVVRLTTQVAGVPPAIGAGLGYPGTVVPTTRGRHAAIPPSAVDLGNGTSRFDPPAGGGLPPVRWIFDNITGNIVKSCSLPLVPPADCSDVFSARLVAGYVAFSVAPAEPTASDAETPASPPQMVGVRVAQTVPADKFGTWPCYVELLATRLAYWCAVRVNSAPGDAWSGRVEVDTAAPLASTPADFASTRQRVCRYTPTRDCHPAVGSTIWGASGSTLACTGAAPTPSRPMRNEDHPLDYLGAKVPLINQNFLVIRAGDGSNPFECPGDDATTPTVNGNTWRHQPAS